MAIDYSVLALPKGRPAKLAKADRLKARNVDERDENAKVRERSGGRCEIVVSPLGRCKRRALHIHHKLSGFGVRGHGDSVKAENKLHVCAQDHSDIHARVLIADGARWKRLK